MSSLATGVLPLAGLAGFHRFSVDDYHRMIETGVLDEEDAVELLEGHVVNKMPHNPPHDGTIQLVQDVLTAILPSGWCLRIQSAITLSDSEPEPDLCLARGSKRTYLTHHPGPADLGMVVEVSDSALQLDRDHKGRIYARAGIPVYWIVNLIDRQVEVYTIPSGPTAVPAFALRQVFASGTNIPVVLAGNSIGQVAVDELLP